MIDRAKTGRVTERINEVCAAEDAGMEPGLKRLQSETLLRRV